MCVSVCYKTLTRDQPVLIEHDIICRKEMRAGKIMRGPAVMALCADTCSWPASGFHAKFFEKIRLCIHTDAGMRSQTQRTHIFLAQNKNIHEQYSTHVCGDEVGGCGAKVGRCGAKVGRCGAKVGRCGTKVGRCGAKVGRCGAKVGRCGMKVGNSALNTELA